MTDTPEPRPADLQTLGQVEERAAIVSWLRNQSDLGANRGNEADKGTTKRAAFGGGSLALSRAADAIDAGEHITNDNAASPIPDDSAGVDDDAENCNRCGAKNPPWSAPSPLWNAVVRGGSINGDPLFNDMLCATCFTVLAEAAGIASNFRLTAVNIHGTLEIITPSGRVWDDAGWLWVDTTPIHPNAGAEDRAREVLAAEYERDGHSDFASEVRSGNLNRTGMGIAIRAMLAFANVHPSAGVGEREAIERSAESIWQQRWFSAPADTPDAIPVETDEPRRFAEMALAALESKQPPATGSVEVHNG